MRFTEISGNEMTAVRCWDRSCGSFHPQCNFPLKRFKKRWHPLTLSLPKFRRCFFNSYGCCGTLRTLGDKKWRGQKKAAGWICIAAQRNCTYFCEPCDPLKCIKVCFLHSDPSIQEGEDCKSKGIYLEQVWLESHGCLEAFGSAVSCIFIFMWSSA